MGDFSDEERKVTIHPDDILLADSEAWCLEPDDKAWFANHWSGRTVGEMADETNGTMGVVKDIRAMAFAILRSGITTREPQVGRVEVTETTKRVVFENQTKGRKNG